jgi:hypothetical protein
VGLITSTPYANTADYEVFSQENWMELWGTIADGTILLDAPWPLRKPVKDCRSMDADHTHAKDRFRPNQ